MNIIDFLIVIGLLIAFPIGVFIFSGKKMNWEDLKYMGEKYQYHFYLLIVVWLVKKQRRPK